MSTLVIADRAFDGVGHVVEAPRLLVGDDSTILSIESGGDAWKSFPDTVLDMRGSTLLPGLIDGHVHLNLPGDGTSFEASMAKSDEQLSAAALASALSAARGGVTTVRDLGGRRLTTYAARDAARAAGVPAARMLLAGPSLTITGGHCRYFGGETDGPDGVRVAVRRRVGEGADWIKIIGSGGGTPNTLSHKPSFTRDEVAAIVDEAHRFDVRVTMHCLCATAMRNAIDAGVDCIEHGWFLTSEHAQQEFDTDVAQRVADAGITVVATLSVGHFILDQYRNQSSSLRATEQAYAESWRSGLEQNLEHFHRLRDAGVRLVGGTDAGWRFTPFDGLATECSLMVEGGMTVREALAACTGRSAEALGVSGETGRLAPGLVADVIAVQGDCMSDIRALKDITLVMRDADIVVCRHKGGASG